MDFKDLKPNTFYTRIVDSGFDVFTFKNTYNNSYLVCDIAFRKNWEICNVSGVRLSTPEEQHWLEECIERDEFIPKTSIIKKEPNYIVGKWYKSTPEENRRRGHTYYGKFAELKNNKFVASECTLGKDKVDGRKHTFESYIWHLLEDLTEIQDLLPNGHPDKTKNTFTDMDIPDYIKNATFKIGQTVKLKSTGSSVSHCAYGAKTGDIVIITKINDLEGSASKKDPRYYGDNFNVRGCDLETIDEIVSKDILVQTNMSQTEACGICKFKNNCSLGPHKSLCPAQNGMHYPDNIDMTSILQECYKKYPIGTIFMDIGGSVNYKVSEELKIQHGKGISHSGIPFVYLRGKYADIIKLPEKNTSKKETLKIGDIVVVTKQYHSGNVPEGNIGKLIGIDDSTVPYDVEWKETSSWCLNVRKATLAEERSYFDSKAKKEPAKDTSAEYKLGDWIFVQQNTTGGCKLELGKVYKVESVNRNNGCVVTALGGFGGEILFRDIRQAYPHEIPKESVTYNVCEEIILKPKVKPLYSDIIEVKKLKTFSK